MPPWTRRSRPGWRRVRARGRLGAAAPGRPRPAGGPGGRVGGRGGRRPGPRERRSGRRAGGTESDHLAAALTAEWIAALVDAGRMDDARSDAVPAANRLVAATRPSRQLAGLRLAVARVTAVERERRHRSGRPGTCGPGRGRRRRPRTRVRVPVHARRAARGGGPVGRGPDSGAGRDGRGTARPRPRGPAAHPAGHGRGHLGGAAERARRRPVCRVELPARRGAPAGRRRFRCRLGRPPGRRRGRRSRHRSGRARPRRPAVRPGPRSGAGPAVDPGRPHSACPGARRELERRDRGRPPGAPARDGGSGRTEAGRTPHFPELGTPASERSHPDPDSPGSAIEVQPAAEADKSWFDHATTTLHAAGATGATGHGVSAGRAERGRRWPVPSLPTDHRRLEHLPGPPARPTPAERWRSVRRPEARR